MDTETKTVNVYVVTPDGTAMTQEGAGFVQDVLCSAVPALADAGFIFHSGIELNDPEALAGALEQDPDNSYAVVAEDGKQDVAFCKHGPGEDGIAAVIGILRDGARRVDPGATSWKILWTSIREGRMAGNGGE